MKITKETVYYHCYIAGSSSTFLSSLILKVFIYHPLQHFSSVLEELQNWSWGALLTPLTLKQLPLNQNIKWLMYYQYR